MPPATASRIKWFAVATIARSIVAGYKIPTAWHSNFGRDGMRQWNVSSIPSQDSVGTATRYRLDGWESGSRIIDHPTSREYPKWREGIAAVCSQFS
jgi:hypothetical protein